MKTIKLLTAELEALFKKTGSQDGKGSAALVITKFFHPFSSYKFYATEYIPEDGTFFGYAILHEQEWGYVSLAELKSIKIPPGFEIDCEIYDPPKKASEIKVILIK